MMPKEGTSLRLCAVIGMAIAVVVWLAGMWYHMRSETQVLPSANLESQL